MLYYVLSYTIIYYVPRAVVCIIPYPYPLLIDFLHPMFTYCIFFLIVHHIRLYCSLCCTSYLTDSLDYFYLVPLISLTRETNDIYT